MYLLKTHSLEECALLLRTGYTLSRLVQQRVILILGQRERKEKKEKKKKKKIEEYLKNSGQGRLPRLIFTSRLLTHCAPIKTNNMTIQGDSLQILIPMLIL